MINEQIIDLIKKAVMGLGVSEKNIPAFTLEHPDEMSHGDFATNIALMLAKPLKKSPKELADNICEKINQNKIAEIEKVEVAEPGFINFYLSAKYFAGGLTEILNKKENYGRKSKTFWQNLFSSQKIIVEYSSPNIAKPFTIGHLRSTIIGDAVANILEFSGYKVIRDNTWGTGEHSLVN